MDKLNSLSYAYHYRDIDLTEHYARLAFRQSGKHNDGKAEAYNNLAFADIMRMRYAEAQQVLDSIPSVTDNQIELLVCYVQQMRLCQRQSRNKDFYDYRERAISALSRINEELDQLTDRQHLRLSYAETELAIVTSTYYYYVGLEQQAFDALTVINPDEVKRDTAQFLNLLYNVGSGGILSEGTATDIWEQEVNHLLRCFQIAQRCGYLYFEANALEAIAEHLLVMPADADAQLSLINPEEISEEELPLWLADEALSIFQDYGDVYQVAGAYRTLASCYWAVGDYEAALWHLEQSLADTTILQAPDLVASIYEQLSVVYAAVDDKPNSDFYRNNYLDLQEQTRQDCQLEARAGQLDAVVMQLNWILAAVVVAIVLLLFLLWLFRRMNRSQRVDSPLDEQIEERREQLAVSRLHIEEGERRHLEQRAKISLVTSLLPLIDRMVYTLDHADTDGEWSKEYIGELVDKMNADNELLTEWIQLRQGQLSLHIESFPLQPLFDMVARSRKSFEMKGLVLNIEPTQAVVKADRILTLFMLNTLADNARKFTAEGSVSIAAEQTADYVEVSVKDTGIGMDEEQLAHVFNHQLTTHGFGLLNCKGIIEKYRKMSQLFSVCTLQAESKQGRGSRFFFRLPIGMLKCWLIGFGTWLMAVTAAMAVPQSSDASLSRAAIYADSAYFSNINGTYERTLRFADSCVQCLNDHYRLQHPQGRTLLLREGGTSLPPPEIQWLHDSVLTNYEIILDIRNESAVAALALHEWQLYSYNNRIYTLLYKELSADATLGDYCRMMQEAKTNRMIALGLLLLALLAILPVYYFHYLRPRLNVRFKAERQRRDELELLDDDLRRTDLELQNLHVSNAVLDNCLSTLKHETMYYPSRIRQLMTQGDMDSAREVVDYYRELYNLLSQQAMSQVERVKLRLRPLEHDILGDEVLVRYLFDLLKRMSGQKRLDFAYNRRDEQYVEVRCQWPAVIVSPKDARNQIDRLLCRQIVRDHGEATNRRACSIRMEQQDNEIKTIIILPAYGKF